MIVSLVWGVSKVAGSASSQITVMSDKQGVNYTVLDSTGQLHKGTVVIKPVYCGKHCAGCPHKFYKYVAWREGKKTKWKYIGKVEKERVNP